MLCSLDMIERLCLLPTADWIMKIAHAWRTKTYSGRSVRPDNGEQPALAV